VDYLQSIASEDLFPETRPVLSTATSPATPDTTKPSEFVSLRDVKPYVAYIAGTTPASWGKTDPNPTLSSFFPAYNTVRGNMIDPSNPAIAWVPFYRRDFGSQFAQVIVIAVRNRERERYVAQYNPLFRADTPSGPQVYSDFDRPVGAPAWMTPPPAFMPATLEPVLVPVGFSYDVNLTHGRVQIDGPVGRARAATGAYLVVAVDPTTHPATGRTGHAIGRIFQLGNPIDEANGLWELSPAGDMIRSDPNNYANVGLSDDADVASTAGIQAYLIGRGYVSPLDGTQGFAGPAQDIAVYTGFISIPPKTTTP
jgi:hypothetical protein